jgi:hypothetical protein
MLPLNNNVFLFREDVFVKSKTIKSPKKKETGQT